MTSTDRSGGLTAQDLESLRAALMKVRDENLADLETATSTLGTLVDDGTAGSPSLREDVANAEYMVQDATSILAMIEAALLRMDDGTYGTCTSCGQQIPLVRLERAPTGPCAWPAPRELRILGGVVSNAGPAVGAAKVTSTRQTARRTGCGKGA